MTSVSFNSMAASYERMAGGATRELIERALPLLPPITSSSVVLDNACGTGLASSAVLRLATPATLHAIDAAPAMVEIAAGVLPPTVHTAVMPGESLSFPDGTFTHSLTNLGLFAFTDPAKGAREIHRTLRDGGVALVTGWASHAHLDIVERVQKTLRPGVAPRSFPISEDWLRVETYKRTLEGAGFGNVEVTTREVCWAAESLDDLVDLLLGVLEKMIAEDLTEGEMANGRKLAREYAEPEVRKMTRPGGGEVLGISLTGIVAICRK
ncbi:uncharacterized protein E0L32_002304 [Thyridium curvatum]|uniref:Methyltransferase type 11 domain-containing protein n=1 Tax=Thyridium curvatum TaxID=1093900 RepID=A0A507APP1_9PEZI|nr:uncharacterized protein E0L32_002304 [Thyridium curvatum]TPX06808.1 hypothetical protein E0L32_002304 [Thyridium curvatum]